MRKPVLPQRRAVCGRGIAAAAADLKFLRREADATNFKSKTALKS